MSPGASNSNGPLRHPGPAADGRGHLGLPACWRGHGVCLAPASAGQPANEGRRIFGSGSAEVSLPVRPHESAIPALPVPPIFRPLVTPYFAAATLPALVSGRFDRGFHIRYRQDRVPAKPSGWLVDWPPVRTLVPDVPATDSPLLSGRPRRGCTR